MVRARGVQILRTAEIPIPVRLAEGGRDWGDGVWGCGLRIGGVCWFV
jgi:hypothetical protein